MGCLTGCKISVILSFLKWTKTEIFSFTYLWINVANIFQFLFQAKASSVDQDQTPQYYAASDHGLHCLQRIHTFGSGCRNDKFRNSAKNR